ncbi:MAG: carboxypeptidase-like regulatory domain-containing protein, partial [Calditrichaeota bacterium]|nr:carboxypeptidase-like regulatory domain-containing protein [Calditrichota bacterium]
MRLKYLLLAVFLLLAVNVNAQTSREGSLSGFIYDDANKEALIGVNIYFPELGIGGSSNTSGYYIIPQIPAGSYTVVCEYIGY